MRFNTFIATTGKSLARATRSAGGTWSVETLLLGMRVTCFATDPHDPSVVHAGTHGHGVLRSEDWGQSWRPAEPGDPYVLGLTVSPTNPNVILAGVELGAVLRSADGGQTWQGHLQGTSRDCYSLAFHTSDGNWAYQGGGGWPAADYGDSWRRLPFNLGSIGRSMILLQEF